MKRRNPQLVGTLAIAAATLAFGSAAAWAATELAKIGTKVISLEEFNKKYQENLKFFQYKAPPSKKSVLDDLIKRELGVQEARKLRLDQDPDVIERIETVLYRALVEKKLGKEFESINITDDEAKRYYEKFPEVRTSHVFVAVPGNASAEDDKKARERIQKIYDEHIRPGKMSFAEVAQRFSEGVAAPMGGDIDYQTKDKLDPAYYDAALKLGKAGKVSGIVRSQAGYHVIKLTAVRPWDEADRNLVKRMLFEERQAQIFDKYMAQLRGQSKVSVNATLIKE
jgi:parvulin-like peptidyl-prolyl isomerase